MEARTAGTAFFLDTNFFMVKWHTPMLLLPILTIVILLIGLPLLGVWMAGKPLAPYVQFFPPPSHVRHAPFSWPIFWTIAVCELIFLGGCLKLILSRSLPPRLQDGQVDRSFPPWGWPALLALLGAWMLAWTRFPWLAEMQPWSFVPLWVSYIVFINALTVHRTGHCLLLTHPRYFFWLFPVSSLLWWYFEYLNHFVQNWRYIGVDGFPTPLAVLHASLAFSTVLPAIVSTQHWVHSFPRMRVSVPLPPGVQKHPRWWAGVICAVSAIAFMGIGVWPNYLFPAIWLAPLGLVLSIPLLFKESREAEVIRRHFRPKIVSTSLAALLCGGLWEMWNAGSLAKWEYTIPFVQGFHLFEMPVVGYGGYIPFGLFCMVIADFVRMACLGSGPQVADTPNGLFATRASTTHTDSGGSRAIQA